MKANWFILFFLLAFIFAVVIGNNVRLERIESKIDSVSTLSSSYGVGDGLDPIGFVKGESSGFIFEVSAYCPCEKCCGCWADGYTASGHKIVQGDKFVTAPPDIPFGTLLAIDGYAGGLPVPVRDRGGAIQGNKLDVFFGGENGHQEALNWGRRKMKVKILKR